MRVSDHVDEEGVGVGAPDRFPMANQSGRLLSPAPLAVVGGVLGLLMFQWGRITGERLLAAFYAVAGATIGIMLVTRLAGALGPVAIVIAAAAGAVVVIYLAKITGRRDGE